MNKNRRDFLKIAGLAGAAGLLPLGKVFSANSATGQSNTCTLIPTETAGPFPLDLTANTFYFRQDIREFKTGVQLNLRLKILGENNCGPMPNLRVNIWHCDKNGLYSGYDQTNNAGQTGFTYLRGYQMTDANGEVEFITIFPGWYPGRICHIHFQVYVNSNYAAISQLTFDIATKQAIYTANSSLYTHGIDPTTLNADNVFSDGYAYQIVTPTQNFSTGGYDAYLEVTIHGSGLVGVGNIEKENAKQFILGQNFPNPYVDQTTIPIHLKRQSDVTLDLYDLSGRKVAEVLRSNMAPGDQQIIIDLKALGLPTGNYVYQVQVENESGVYRDCKVMTFSN